MVVVVVYKLNLVKCFWPKASPLDVLCVCARAKLGLGAQVAGLFMGAV